MNRWSSYLSSIVFLAYTLLTLLLTWPLAFNLTTAVPNDIGDPLLNTWILAWDTHALLTDPLNLFNANIFHPLPNTLAYSEHLLSTALLALPLQLITAEPVAAYNLSLLLSFPLTAFGMYLLVLRWTHCRSAAFVAGLIFGFAPYRFAAIAHLQLLTFQWLPLALLCLDSLRRRTSSWLSTPRLQIALALFLTLQLLASWYLALYSSLIVGLYILLTRQKLRPLALPLAVTTLLILPLAWPYLTLLDQLRTARPLSLAVSLAAAPTDFIAAAPFNRLFGPLTEPLRNRPGFIEEHMLFVGLVAPLLALIGLLGFIPAARNIRRSRPAVGLALLLIFSVSLLLTFPGPYTALAQLLPPTTVVRVPARWIIPALFALAGLAGLGYARLHHALAGHLVSQSAGLLLLSAALLLAESLSVPLPLAAVENRRTINPAYHWLASRSDASELALLELPIHSAPAPEFPEVKRLYASTLGWWKLINGYSGYTPPRQPQLAAALTNFPNSTAVAALQALVIANPAAPLYVLVHPGQAPIERSRWETQARWQAARQPALRLMGRFEGDYLYRVMSPGALPFSNPPLALFGPDRQILLRQIEIRDVAGDETWPHLVLYWEAVGVLPANYTVFIHLRAVDGFVRSQADGPPVAGHYPTAGWPPGLLIQDSHPLPPDWSQADHLAIGLYLPTTGRRLPAFDGAAFPLPDNALIVPLNP